MILLLLYSRGSFNMQQCCRTVWQEGMHIQYPTEQIMIEPMRFRKDGNKPGIRVTVTCKDGVFKAMGFVIDRIEALLEEWYPGKMISLLSYMKHGNCEACIHAY